ncbi:hypothetical protein QL285_071137 [Trifolium repens]|nr:hypothetical protein QL285_071137 [Trifolium repens]
MSGLSVGMNFLDLVFSYLLELNFHIFASCKTVFHILLVLVLHLLHLAYLLLHFHEFNHGLLQSSLWSLPITIKRTLLIRFILIRSIEVVIITVSHDFVFDGESEKGLN